MLTNPRSIGEKCAEIDKSEKALLSVVAPELTIHSSNKKPKVLNAEIKMLSVSDEIYRPAAEKAASNKARASKPAEILPRSSSVPIDKESGIKVNMNTKIIMNMNMPKNLPNTI